MLRKTLALVLSAVLAPLCLSAQAQATTLTQDDVALALYWTSATGTSYTALDSTALAGFFGVHRCVCTDSLTVQLQLSSAGQTAIGSSTIGATFLLGQNCAASPSACTTLGAATFTASQSAASPSFLSSLVYQAVEGTTTVNCGALVAGSTTLWAIITQDGQALSFSLQLALPVVTATVGAPTAVTAEPGNQGLLVSWSPPSDAALVAGYQVLCLPGPSTAQVAAYETCGLTSSAYATLNPTDAAEVCSQALSASTTSVRLTGLSNGTAYRVAVVAIDASGGISALSPVATATPQVTEGFWEKYKDGGGAATGCSLALARRSSGKSGAWLIVLAALAWLAGPRRWRRGTLLVTTVGAALAWAATASAWEPESFQSKSTDDWARAEPSAMAAASAPPEYALELGLSWYRPAIDQEFQDLNDSYHPFADTFGGSRRPLWEMELDRYLVHRFGTWGVGVRVGYYKVTASAFLADGTRSGDETALRLIPISPSLIYRANGLPGLRLVPLIPYAKLGLDATSWSVTTTGRASHSGLSMGWHAAAGVMLGFDWLGGRPSSLEGIADPCALFFEWDYAQVKGLGLSKSLDVGDNIWFAGLMFDL